MRLERTVNEGEIILSDGAQRVLTIRENQENDDFTIELDGSLKSDTVHELQDELEMLLVMGFDLKVDLRKTTFVSAACADVFLNLQLKVDEREKGSLTLVNVPQKIMEEFRNTGIAELLRIE